MQDKYAITNYLLLDLSAISKSASLLFQRNDLLYTDVLEGLNRIEAKCEKLKTVDGKFLKEFTAESVVSGGTITFRGGALLNYDPTHFQ
eukprot:SAG11_NODE_18290_length_495_cov_0.901515_2_plen_89_part_00